MLLIGDRPHGGTVPLRSFRLMAGLTGKLHKRFPLLGRLPRIELSFCHMQAMAEADVPRILLHVEGAERGVERFSTRLRCLESTDIDDWGFRNRADRLSMGGNVRVAAGAVGVILPRDVRAASCMVGVAGGARFDFLLDLIRMMDGADVTGIALGVRRAASRCRRRGSLK